MAAVRGASRPTIEPIVRPGWRSPRVGIALLCLSAALFSVSFAQEWWVSSQIKHQAAQLQAAIDQTNAQNAQLQAQIDYYSSPAYIKLTAHQLGMTSSGVTLMYVQPQTTTVRTVHRTVPRSQPQPQGFLARLLRLIFQ